jgi:succinate-semialdehyde dehydrogenase/glutarate-semialdehyde dehydrogenase
MTGMPADATRPVRMIESIDPATGAQVAVYAETTPAEVLRAIERADLAHQSWRRVPPAQRAAALRRVGAVLRDGAESYAQLMTCEMGKPILQARAEVEKCAWVCDYYAEQGPTLLAPTSIRTDARHSFVTFQPLGVVLAIMPWNFPFWQVLRFAAPTLLAGNGAILKHASNVSGCALALAKLFREADFPEDLFATVLVGVEEVGPMIEHPLVRAVTVTGSTAAGKAVAARAGALAKKTVLELGGSDAYVVLEDADLNRTVESCVASRLINGGQSCIAAKRFIVVEAVQEDFLERFVAAMAARTMGDPRREDIDLGPLARNDLRDKVHRQVVESHEQGARVLLGGVVPEGPGAYYRPTVLAGVQPGMPAYHEELFGPVAAVISARDETDAVRIANDSPYGLGAAVFTGDLARGERIATEELQAGSCFVNAFVKSDPRLPFGGIKESGYGRELSSFGAYEFVNVKTIYVA